MDTLLHDMSTKPILHVGKYESNPLKLILFKFNRGKMKICKILYGVRMVSGDEIEKFAKGEGIDYCCSISNQ